MIRTILALAAIAAVLAATPALAAQKVVAVVHAASAVMRGHVLILDATVDLPNTCWSNPHFAAPPHHRPGHNGQVRIEVLATTTERPGRACGMVYRPSVAVPSLRWAHPPQGLRSITVVGSRTPAVATVVWPSAPPPRRH